MQRSTLRSLWSVALVAGVTFATSAQPSLAQRAQKPRRLLRPARPFAISSFPALRWKATLGVGANAAPVVADLDSDGALDVVVPAVNGGTFGSEGKPTLVRLNEGGGVIWRYRLPAPVTAGVTMGDVDRNGTLDLLVACGQNLLCLDARGRLLWKFTTTKNIESIPTIADLDLDGKSEVLFGADDNFLHVLNSQGKERWKFQTRSWITGGVCVANVQGDKKLEVVFGSLDANIYCLDARGKKLWQFETDDWVASAPAVGDVDRDGFLETVALSDDGNLYCLSRRGTLKWKAAVNEAETRSRAFVTLADLDGEGSLETLVYSASNESLNCYLSNGDAAWKHDIDGGTVSAPLVADLDGNGYQEIVMASEDGTLMGLSTWGDQRWSVNLGQTIVSTPALADFDHDGKWEIYVANLMEARKDSGFLSAYEMSVKGGKGAWPSLKGDPYRTGIATNARDFGAILTRGGDYATSWEPFGAGYRPQTGVLAPRRLRVSLMPLDDARGNRDGALDAGETAWVRVKVQNLGKGASYDNLLKLDLGRSFLKLDRTTAYLGWIAPGATKTAVFRLTAPSKRELDQLSETDGPFVDVEAPLDETPERVAGSVKRTGRRKPAARYGPQDLSLAVYESGVPAALSRVRVFDVPPLPPRLQIVRSQIIDTPGRYTSGNGNGRLDAGESVVLRLLVRNENLTTATSATATLSSANADVLPATSAAPMSQVVPYGGRNLAFSLRVAKRPTHKQAVLKLSTYAKTKAGTAPVGAQLLKLPIGGSVGDVTPPQILLESPKTQIATTRSAKITLRGRVTDASALASLSFERRAAKFLPGQRWAFTRALKVGENVFPILATDVAGNSTTRWIRVIRRP